MNYLNPYYRSEPTTNTRGYHSWLAPFLNLITMTAKEYIRVFDLYRMKVFYFSKRMLNNQEDAEDITSSVFLKLWERRQMIRLVSAESFLMITTKNACIDFIKCNKHIRERQNIAAELLEEYELPFDDPYSLVISHIYSTLKELTPRQREVFTLKFLEERDYPYICEKLNIKMQTAANIVYDAVQRIRNKVKRH